MYVICLLLMCYKKQVKMYIMLFDYQRCIIGFYSLFIIFGFFFKCNEVIGNN